MEEFLKDVGEYKFVSWAIMIFFLSLSLSLFLSVYVSFCLRLSCSLSLFPSFPLSNDSWYNIRVFYTGIINEGNTTENVSPSVDIYYLLNFDDIARSYGKHIISCGYR